MSLSRSFQKIPLIDISGLYSEHIEDRMKVANNIAEAASNVGFLYITGHQIPKQIIENLISTAKAFFARPLTEKMNYYIGNSKNHSGYVPEGEEGIYAGKVDHKEAYDVNNDITDPKYARPMLGPDQWPDDESFKGNVTAYYNEVLSLSRLLFRGFALALGLDEYTFSEITKRPPNQLRLLHYPYDGLAQDMPGIGAHTDYECFTILLPTADGLEVMNDRGEWINAPVVQDAFVINISDMMEIISNGRFIATAHRVRKVQEERYSFPFFCTCDYDTVIHPMIEKNKNSNNTIYEPICCGDHLYAQTIQTFNYLKKKLSEGEIKLPDSSRPLTSFGRLKTL